MSVYWEDYCYSIIRLFSVHCTSFDCLAFLRPPDSRSDTLLGDFGGTSTASTAAPVASSTSFDLASLYGNGAATNGSTNGAATSMSGVRPPMMQGGMMAPGMMMMPGPQGMMYYMPAAPGMMPATTGMMRASNGLMPGMMPASSGMMGGMPMMMPSGGGVMGGGSPAAMSSVGANSKQQKKPDVFGFVAAEMNKARK